MAMFNRAVLLDQTGDLRAAIADYSKIIKQFPNFWVGLSRRASCYRRLGETNKAELDEFRILKAQMDKHLGIQPRWTKSKLQEVRRRSDIDPNKYNQLVIADDNQNEREYQSKYRGKVQNRRVNIDFLPEFPITGFDAENGQSMLQNYADAMTESNTKRMAGSTSLADVTSQINNDPQNAVLYYTRGTLLAKQGDYADAIKDLTQAVSLDPLMPEAYFNRGLCYIFSDRRPEGMNDLSKAGELGLYSAYSVMKKFNSEKK
jgi:tetratricopeptide (TPR) repeat protein